MKPGISQFAKIMAIKEDENGSRAKEETDASGASVTKYS